MITYCITVYNEVNYIKNLVENIVSAKNEEEEIVVVQTYRDEHEKNSNWYQEIRNYLNSKNIPEYTYKFDGKFSNLKNFATSLASKEYVLNLDADENLKIEAFPIIRQILKETNLDLYLLPRINIVEGLTQEDVAKWGWNVNEKGWVNWPDLQPRLYRNNTIIRWSGDVHETLQGYSKYGSIQDEVLAIIHSKDIERQRQQNEFYEEITRKKTSPISIKKYRALVGLCSWNNPQLLMWCVESLLASIDRNQDQIAVVLNEGDQQSIAYLHQKNIPFVYNPENSGPLAIDFLKGYIERSEYFINSNDDMIYHVGFMDDLISIIESNYPCTASCGLVENFYSNNPAVVVNQDLVAFDENSINLFLQRQRSGDYNRPQPIYGYNHPIMCKSQDLLDIGGYSGNWDMNFLSGYSRDDAFPYLLWKKSDQKYKFIMSNKSVVFHLSSFTNKKLASDYRAKHHNQDQFCELSGMTLQDFRFKHVKIGETVS